MDYHFTHNGVLTNDHNMITVHLKTAGLAVGEYDKNITIMSADTNVTNSPQTIPLHVSVKGIPELSKGGGGGGEAVSYPLLYQMIMFN